MNDESWEAVLPPMLRAAGLPDAGFAVEPLTGGVSSDIVKVTLADGQLACAKRALGKLKVASDWQAPLERNHYEVAWLRRASAIAPGAAPKVFAEDEAHGIALLEFLPPGNFLLWKSELLAGRADPDVPVRVADALGRIHRTTLNDATAAAEFPTDHLIDALRFDPYLRFLAGRYPDLAPEILATLERSWRTKLALVHGDVSPKNILIGKADGQPVLLDAECAWYGDPAFDIAFCANHLLLKAVWKPQHRRLYAAAFEQLVSAYLAGVWWEPPAELQARAAALLSALLLARIDGKSPVEYLTDEAEKDLVRAAAAELLALPHLDFATVAEALHRRLETP